MKIVYNKILNKAQHCSKKRFIEPFDIVKCKLSIRYMYVQLFSYIKLKKKKLVYNKR